MAWKVRRSIYKEKALVARIILKIFSCFFLMAPLFGRCQITNDPNPLLADPTILYYNQLYYLYGTNGGNSNKGFTVFTSKDKLHWRNEGWVLKPGDAFGTRGFWAPQVFFYNTKFYMAYTANEHIAIAVADNPLGPFKQKMIKALDGPVRMIDPYLFFDAGKIYLYHVRLQEGNRIFVAEMTSDLSTIKENTLKECIHVEPGWEDTQKAKWGVAEGPTVFKHDKMYYMFYSANDFRNPDYAIGYATSTSPIGPWKKYKGNPIVSRKMLQINGTGHGDLFKDPAGKMYYVFHTHNSDSTVAPRKSALIELQFKKNRKEPDAIEAVSKTFQYLKKIK